MANFCPAWLFDCVVAQCAIDLIKLGHGLDLIAKKYADGLKEFSRVANRKNPNGYYIEVGFEGVPENTGDLKKRLLKIKDIFRVFITKQD